MTELTDRDAAVGSRPVVARGGRPAAPVGTKAGPGEIFDAEP